MYIYMFIIIKTLAITTKITSIICIFVDLTRKNANVTILVSDVDKLA